MEIGILAATGMLSTLINKESKLLIRAPTVPHSV